MSYRPGDTFYSSFTTQTADGSATDADAAPAASLRRNGLADAAVAVAVAHNASGDYTASATLPLTYSGGDEIELVVTATVSGVSARAVFSLGKLDRTAQAVAQVVYRTGRAHFVSAAGDVSRDGFSPETAKALPTQPVPGPGETVLVFSGTFPLGTSVLDLSGDGVTGVHLLGNAPGATVISSNALLAVAGCIVKPGNGSQVCDLTIQGTAATFGTTDQYQAPFGAGLGQTPFFNAVARRLNLVGDSDGFYINRTSDAVTLRAFDCMVQSKYDALNLNGSAAARMELHNCRFNVVGPSTCNGGTVARAITVQGGTLEIHGGTYTAAGGSTTTRGIQTSSSGAAAVYHAAVHSASGAGTVSDFDNSGAGLGVYDCNYNAAAVNGAITNQNSPASLAPAQNYNNTGQTTPLPSGAAFSGPNSVTLVFHDSGGAIVPGVVFTVRGLGSAVTDASGAKTIALPAGAFTIQAMANSGTLWADTPITVTGGATFVITGTAAAAPPPSPPAQTTAYLTTRDGQGNPLAGVTLTFQLIDPQSATDSYDQTTFTATSNAAAALNVSLLKSTKYQARLNNGAWVPFTTGASPTYALPEILGTSA